MRVKESWVKQLISEVFSRLGARKAPPLQPGWASSPNWQNGRHNPAAAPQQVPPPAAPVQNNPTFSALEPPVLLGSMASPDYIASLNRRISRFKQRVAALEKFMQEEPERGTRRSKKRR